MVPVRFGAAFPELAAFGVNQAANARRLDSVIGQSGPGTGNVIDQTTVTRAPEAGRLWMVLAVR